MEEYVSKLDSTRFGFKIAKINDWKDCSKDVIHLLREQQVKLVIARLPSEQISAINLLEALGFQIKDTQLTYKYLLKNLSFATCDNAGRFQIREAVEHDIEQVATIAQRSFYQYGHYYSNERLDENKKNEIYSDWAQRSFFDKAVADKFFVAVTEHNDVAGFLTFKCTTKNDSYFAQGGIGAVSEHYRNQQIFHLLVKHGLLWGQQEGQQWQEHNALTTNYAVGKVFTSIGFHNAASFVTLHGWLD